MKNSRLLLIIVLWMGMTSQLLGDEKENKRFFFLYDPIRAICTSPDDSLILCQGLLGRPRIVVAKTGEIIAPKGEFELSYAGEFLNEKTLLLSNCWEKGNELECGFVFYSLDRKEVEKTVKGHDEPISALAVSRGGKLIATGDSKGKLVVWNEKGEKIWSTGVGRDEITALSFSPDSRLIACTGRNKTAPVFDALSGQEKGVIDHKSRILALRFCGDQTVMSADFEGNINISNLGKKTVEVKRFPDPGIITVLSFSMDCKKVAVGNLLGNLFVYDVGKGEKTFTHQEKERIQVVAFSRDGRYLMAGVPRDNLRMLEKLGGELSVWDLKRD